MIVHIAIYKWKPGVTEAQITAALKEVRLLKKKIPGVIDIKCGKNFSKWSEGYQYAIVVWANDITALDLYRSHPDHEKVAKVIETYDAGSIGIDFEDSF